MDKSNVIEEKMVVVFDNLQFAVLGDMNGNLHFIEKLEPAKTDLIHLRLPVITPYDISLSGFPVRASFSVRDLRLNQYAFIYYNVSMKAWLGFDEDTKQWFMKDEH